MDKSLSLMIALGGMAATRIGLKDFLIKDQTMSRDSQPGIRDETASREPRGAREANPRSRLDERLVSCI